MSRERKLIERERDMNGCLQSTQVKHLNGKIELLKDIVKKKEKDEKVIALISNQSHLKSYGRIEGNQEDNTRPVSVYPSTSSLSRDDFAMKNDNNTHKDIDTHYVNNTSLEQ